MSNLSKGLEFIFGGKIMQDLTTKQVLSIKAYSKYFKNTYKSEIVEMRADGIVIKTPREGQRPILMGVGTRMEITAHRIDQDIYFEAELLARMEDDQLMLITRPDQINRSGGRQEVSGARVLAITSGKGGVGKSSMTVNMGLALIRQGYRVGIIDADLGTANLDILLGLRVQGDLSHVIMGEKEITQVLIKGPEGLILVPGGSGFQEMTELTEWQFTQLIQSFNYLDDICDYILIDTGAGLSRNVTNFLLAADEVFVVTTPEPHAITDGYAIIKVISELKQGELPLHLLVNKVETYAEGDRVGKKMCRVARDYLNLDIHYLGSVLDDKEVVRSNKKRSPILIEQPNSRTSKKILEIISGYVQTEEPEEKSSGITSFIRKFSGFFKGN